MNKRLSELIIRWQDSGSEPQEAFNWSAGVNRWTSKFPMHAHFLQDVLPSELDRDKLRSICEDPGYDIIQKFLAVMVWGYGDRGYGPYRVDIMLSQPHAEKVLSESFALAINGDPNRAYDYLRKNRIQKLGPSFGTKFLSFCTPRNIGAPIYDSLVGTWVTKYAKKEFIHVSTNPEVWNSRTYSAYWVWIKKHAEQFNCYPDDVELVLFRDAEKQFSKNSSWLEK